MTESVYSVSYLPNTDKVLLTSGSQAKVFSREEAERTQANLTLFANFPKSQTDEVALSIGKVDLEFLLEKLPWDTSSQSVVSSFIKTLETSYNPSGSIMISYFDALQAVQVMLMEAIQLYQSCELAGF